MCKGNVKIHHRLFDICYTADAEAFLDTVQSLRGQNELNIFTTYIRETLQTDEAEAFTQYYDLAVGCRKIIINGDSISRIYIDYTIINSV